MLILANFSKKPGACYLQMIDYLLESFDHVQIDRSCMICTTNAIPKPHNNNFPIHCVVHPLLVPRRRIYY
ncbi:uncharacterized protein Bfra_012281 [Botrytis fragariae]|uniref:Uncharacterized protein n=1 Tax=Botrytis fragariae TaxID=1964551 RepID=A0A8H6AJX6_9HELO|nr:uncharacterized protein Bfra_012281 [Botrytis fragariae]KAF5868633.1 hypothetical protein Bfra_012281 [Botrytis fragariae]